MQKQNAAARLVTGAHRRDHITPVLWQLDWLPVHQRVVFKVTGLCISRLLELLPHTWLTTVVFYRTLVAAQCDPIQMTCGSCLCR